jgi:hypothetical protein
MYDLALPGQSLLDDRIEDRITDFIRDFEPHFDPVTNEPISGYLIVAIWGLGKISNANKMADSQSIPEAMNFLLVRIAKAANSVVIQLGHLELPLSDNKRGNFVATFAEAGTNNQVALKAHRVFSCDALSPLTLNKLKISRNKDNKDKK